MLPPPPSSSFASDNTAGIAPEVLAALVDANEGPAIAYGDDAFTAELQAQIRDLFGPNATALLAWGGTGANIVGLQSLLRPYEGIVCPSSAHINVDECGAVERIIGCKILDVETPDGKLRPEHVTARLEVIGDVHHVQPGAISVSQSTEYGTVYTVDELAEVIAVAKAAGLRVHVDGARIANAAAALGVGVQDFTTSLGVDALSFGGTKNGMAYGEAVILLDPDLVEPARYFQKQSAQLPSKMRYVAAQLSALLSDELWLRHGAHANAMATRLANNAREIDRVVVTQDPKANAVFAELPPASIEVLQKWSYFYVWNPAAGEVRWMTSYATTEADVDAFLDGVAAVLENESFAGS